MPTLLHVGCGQERKESTTAGFNTPDWTELRLDISPEVKPDIVASMTDMSPVETASVDAIFSSHNIEHLYAHELPLALAEFRRVLKPTGYAVVTCPDLQQVAMHVAEGRLTEPLYTSPAGPISAHDIIYGHASSLAAGQLYMAHRSGFTLKSLADALVAAGFAKITAMRRRTHLDLWAVAAAGPISDAELQAIAALHFPPTPAA